MEEHVLDLAKTLIEIESISGNERPMADWLDQYLSAKGWKVVRQTVVGDRQNIYAHRPGRTPRLIFNSHIDTVPPFFPYSRDDSFIYGRGACDTKSLIAAQLLAAQKLVEEGYEDVGLLYVVGEEVDHIGMLKANELGLNPEYLIVGEPTENKLGRRQKGIYKFQLTTKGTAAHSGYPETGVDALAPMLDVLTDIRHADWPADVELGSTTVNIGVLTAGRAANIVPDHAYAEVMVRVVTNADEIGQRMHEIVGDRAVLTLITQNNPTELTTLPGFESAVVAFNTDIPYLEFDGKALLWGAGSILNAHTAGEKIGIEELKRAPGTYYSLAKRCLQG